MFLRIIFALRSTYNVQSALIRRWWFRWDRQSYCCWGRQNWSSELYPRISTRLFNLNIFVWTCYPSQEPHLNWLEDLWALCLAEKPYSATKSLAFKSLGKGNSTLHVAFTDLRYLWHNHVLVHMISVNHYQWCNSFIHTRHFFSEFVWYTWSISGSRWGPLADGWRFSTAGKH